MRILIAWISQFLGRNGGMEKVSIRFANEMVRRGHSVDLAYCTERDGKVYTPIDPCVGVVNIAHIYPEENGKAIKLHLSRSKERLCD